MPTPALKQKLLRLAEAFEGSGNGNAAGNFDGQLLSWGALHWNFGQGTLLNLLLDIAGSDVTCADLLGPIERTRHQFGMTLLGLKEKGEITIQDIEDVYNGVVIPREQGSILTSTD